MGWSGPLTRVHQTLLQVLQLTRGQSMPDPSTAVGTGLQSVSLQALLNYPITAFKRLAVSQLRKAVTGQTQEAPELNSGTKKCPDSPVSE